MNISMFGQEFRDALSLVRREIVRNDVDFFALGLVHHEIVEKRHELGRGMPLRRLSQHRPSPGIERGIQRQRAMPVVLEAVPFGGPGDSGNTGSLRSRDWIAVFSSTKNTAA